MNQTKGTFGKYVITFILIFFCILWTLPTVGIFVTSFRTADAASSTGWWKAFSDLGNFTLDNYNQVLFGQRYSVGSASGTQTVRGATMLSAFLSSITVTLPSVIIPILIASAAAYGFAWLSFKGRNVLFATIIMLLVVPLQISLIPILRDYNKVGLNGTYLGIWLAHCGFGLPLATYMMYNYISSLPRSILESAFIEGASHFTTFVRLILPLSAPAIASFAIFQFIWVWNDMLVSLVFLSGAGQKLQVVTVRLMNMAGTRGTDWHLLTAGAFVSMILPLGVFLGLQKFFVRGLLAGSVKG
ncbi:MULTISPECIES: carbohydrate ABC transporter permease [Treponema]|uniref:Carbohydrate ABC transporter membrane protein 2, CUT1 family n=1 Tax=Treponema saccharophilum DSM 2985 TaxID=907348 RepID=H7EJ45_9SPIR|nr:MULTISPECIES: carbohydrate ABC transporter permease [Treponema]EIC02359.1 carbohydrate ABC transporter membrane protein 2, CUT1 family [Treponema saccharophilum DSM 2985]MBQ5538509.1 carbohydrate ABC transporter permease [Treponema sp.]BDC97395.1 sugar ABC transporter permease [Treponema saccharophilum]